MELHLESFPLAPLINDVAKTIEPMATKNGNRIVVDCSLDLGNLYADQIRFRQALLNLASNANKFTFPRDADARFIDSVASGKHNMPPWDDVLDPEEIEALWAYVIGGEPAN